MGLENLMAECKLKLLNGGKCPLLTKISNDYKSNFNIDINPFNYKGNIEEETGKKIADIFDSIDHKPNDKLVQNAYSQLAEEVINQFNYLMEKCKIELEPYTGKGEPYSNSYEMFVDVHSFHLYFFKTENGFGESDNINENNAMLHKSGIIINDYELVINDLFRIIHDVFGHAMNGYGFGEKGEDKAWFEHLKMFSPLAGSALSMETRGQNCWVNFGKHLRDKNNMLFKKGQKDWIPPSKRPFAKQKMNILPSFITGIEVYEKDECVRARYINKWDPFLNI